MLNWLKGNNNNSDVVISSRIRLARNLKEFPFSTKISNEQANLLLENIKNGFFQSNNSIEEKYKYIVTNEMTNLDKIALLERHVISPMLINKKETTGLILSDDESKSIMINEEDHVRIQCLAQGMNLEKTFEEANIIDDILESYLDYAYDEKYGYLTSCPTNVGTGLRASYMIHVPALESTGKLQFILEAIGKFGITVRGIYGEGTQAEGSIYQISNQITLGQSEQDIIENLKSVTLQIVDQERKVRNNLLNEKKYQLEDAIYRSYGILSNARVITSKEAMTLLSDVKIGIELGIIKLEKELNIYELMMNIQPANLQRNTNKDLTSDNRDIERANYLRNNLPKIKDEFK